jgi:hypothetical protein
MNLMQAGEINSVFEELGYAFEEIPEINSLIQGNT